MSQQIAAQYLHFSKIVSAAIQAKNKFGSLFKPQNIKDYFPEADITLPTNGGSDAR
ncbi:MAG: hypothetical protein ABI177_12155 [Edaphobacter sp.]